MVGRPRRGERSVALASLDMMQRTGRVGMALLAAGALLAGACTGDDGESTSSTSAPPSTSAEIEVDAAGLPADAVAIMESDDYANAQWTLLVAPVEGGDPTYQLNPAVVGTMASNTKLYSVGTWLDVYGADHTITTPVFGLGEVSDGALDGPLVLRAMGDLVMGSRNAGDGSGELAYSVPPQGDANGLPGAKPAPGDPLAGLDELAAQVADAGVTSVTGDVVIDDRLFEQWETPRPLEISPIIINDNLLSMVTSPAEDGEPATVETIPETEAFTVDVQVETVAAGGDTSIDFAPVLDADGEPTNVIELTGTIAADADPVLRVYEVPEPADYARTLFIEALERAGVSVQVDPLAPNDVAGLPSADEYTADGERLAALESPPISEMATLIFKISHNYGADLTVCLLAVEEGSTDCEDGFAPIRERIDDLGIGVGEVWMLDGSGSSYASTTPEAMVTWLQWLHTLDFGDQLPEMLPILATDGSLSLAQPGGPATGKVQAKTGTYAGLDPSTGRLVMLDQSLAGFLEADDGSMYAFALYMHGASFDSPDQIIGVLDDIAGVAAAIQQSL